MLGNVNVDLYKDGELVSNTTTNSAGTYSFDQIVYGDYTAVFTKEGYVEATLSFTVERETTQLSNVYMAIDSAYLSTISGSALDSKTARGISEITIYVRNGLGNIDGEVLYTLETKSSGAYSLSNVSAGNYTLQFVDERSVSTRYISTYINVTAVGGSKVYDGTVGSGFSISVSGLRGTDTVAKLGTPSYSGEASTSANVGSHK